MKSIKSIIKEELARIINENDRKEELLKYLENDTLHHLNRAAIDLKRMDYELINRELKTFINYVNSNLIENLLGYSSDPDSTAKEIVRLKGKNLDSDSVEQLMKNVSNPDAIGNRIIGLALYYGEDSSSKISELKTLHNVFKNLSNPNAIVDLVLKSFKNLYGKKIDSNILGMLLYYSSNKDETINKLIQHGGNKLNKDDIYLLLKYSPNKENTKNLLIQAGVNRSLIQ